MYPRTAWKRPLALLFVAVFLFIVPMEAAMARTVFVSENTAGSAEESPAPQPTESPIPEETASRRLEGSVAGETARALSEAQAYGTVNASGSNAQKLSLGSNHSAVIKSDGSLWMWGDNYFGQLGDGTQTNRRSPVKIMENVAAVSLGHQHSAAIKTDRSLWMWGHNYRGPLGDGTEDSKSYPVKIMDNVAAVSLGHRHSAAIKTDGSLWMWGDNHDGRLGDGTQTERHSPVKIMENVVAVSLGHRYSAAITTDGSLWMWGYNSDGQLGDGTTTTRYSPIRIMENVASVSLGSSHSVAIKTDGSLWMWGDNSHGQLGNGTTTNSLVPIKIMENVVAGSLGAGYSAAIKTDGSLWMWGDNFDGQLGNGTTTNSLMPIKISKGNVAAVSLGTNHSAAIKTDGSLLMWGKNPYGQLGNGTTIDSPVPVKIMDTVPPPPPSSKTYTMNGRKYFHYRQASSSGKPLYSFTLKNPWTGAAPPEGSTADGGCFVTSAAMLLSNKEQRYITPDMIYFLANQGRKVYSMSMCSWGTLLTRLRSVSFKVDGKTKNFGAVISKGYSWKTQEVSDMTVAEKQDRLKALLDAHPEGVMVFVRNGAEKKQHYFVCVGYNAKGELLVTDPVNAGRRTFAESYTGSTETYGKNGWEYMETFRWLT